MRSLNESLLQLLQANALKDKIFMASLDKGSHKLKEASFSLTSYNAVHVNIFLN